MPLSRGSSHVIEEPMSSFGGVQSGLQAMLMPTASTHPGATVLSHIGVSSSGPRIVIPLPAALATATALMGGGIVPTPIAGASGTTAAPAAPLPSMLIDSEWFMPQSYPPLLQQYISASFAFDLRPTSPISVIEVTQHFLRTAYTNRNALGLTIKIADGLKAIFDDLTSMVYTGKVGRPKHPYGESEATNTGYLVLAYVMSTILWTTDKNALTIRNYPEVTYPGVIMASIISRMVVWYHDVSAALGLLNSDTPYLNAGGTLDVSDTSAVLNHADSDKSALNARRSQFINAVPSIAVVLKTAALFATKRLTLAPGDNCTKEQYKALQDAALNVKGLSKNIAREAIILNAPVLGSSGNAQTIMNTRCLFMQGLIRGTISPTDEVAASTIPHDGGPGIEPLDDGAPSS